MKEQRRGRKIAMTQEEINAHLCEARTCRVATVGAEGAPHISPLWFVWDGSALWLNSIVKSQRWTDIERDPRVALAIDGGEAFLDLHGLEITGTAAAVGEVPRTDAPSDEVAEAERLFGEKYANGKFQADGRHAWLRVTPEKFVSWDFRKMMQR